MEFFPLLFILFLFALLYFTSIRPQQKRQKEINAMLDALEKGDEISTAGGILGKVRNIKGPYVAIEVSENVTFKIQKTAIANTLPKGTIDSINKQFMNKYPTWRYFVIIAVLMLGILYALPNLYPAQPAIQVAYTDSSKSADQSLLNTIREEISNEVGEIQ